MAINKTDKTQPNYVRPEVLLFMDDLQLIDDLLGGTRRMWARATTYIRKWKDEHPQVYKVRRVCESVFQGFEVTLSACVGMLFAKPPGMEWNQSEAAMKEYLDNIDGRGTKFTVFAKRAADASLRDGFTVMLVDHPSTPLDADGKPVAVVTAGMVERYNLRPKVARYDRGRVVNWKTGIVNNRNVLTMLVLHEPGEKDDPSSFGTTPVERYRVLRLLPDALSEGDFRATWQLYEEAGNDANGGVTFRPLADPQEFVNKNGEVARRLPIAIAYSGRTDTHLVASIPLMGVAWANLGHWQIATNLRFNRDVCGFEQLVITGEIVSEETDVAGQPLAGKVRSGPLAVIHVREQGKAEWIGPSGKGLEQLEKGKQEKLTEIAQQGVSFMQPDTRAAETAEAKRIDSTAQNATLSTAAQGIEDGANEMLEIFAWYLGIEKKDAPVMTISRDYETQGMPPEMLRAWAEAIAKAGLPVELMLEDMQVRGLIKADVKIDALAAEIKANVAAKEEQERMDEEERFRQQQESKNRNNNPQPAAA